MIEEFGGTWCGNCPYGTWLVDSMAARLGAGLVRLSWHQGDDPLAIRAEDTLEEMVGASSFPTASVNRNRTRNLTSLEWDEDQVWYVAARDDAMSPPPAVLAIENRTFDPAARAITLDLRVTPKIPEGLPKADSIEYFTVAVLTEDSIIASQRIYNKPFTYITDFVHNDVVRMVGGSVLGDMFTLGNGTAIARTYSFSLPGSINPAHVRAKAFVGIRARDGSWARALDASETPDYATTWSAAGANGPVTTGAISLRNQPNPFNGTTTIRYRLAGRSNILLTVYDQLGREAMPPVRRTEDAGEHAIAFSRNGLPAGIYFCTLRVGETVVVTSMVAE
ncbi:MAG: Omp28-related outer membrane protein [Candidatus Kapaibacterium sp.]